MLVIRGTDTSAFDSNVVSFYKTNCGSQRPWIAYLWLQNIVAAYHNELRLPMATKFHFCDGILSPKPMFASAGGAAAEIRTLQMQCCQHKRGKNVFTLIKYKYYADSCL